MKVAMEDQLQATKQLAGGLTETTLTIAAGVVTPVGGVHAVDTESAAVADDLATIATTNLPDGSLLWLHTVSASRVVTVKHNAGGAGQIALKASADLALASPNLWLVVKRTGTDWQEVGQFSPTGSSVVLGAPVVRGAVGARASTTTYTVSSAAWIAFYRPSTGGIEKTVTAQGTLTVDAGTFARNGRDQSGAFSANTWLYLYYTWDGSTVALRLSTAAPPTGPTLGSGETSWAFICALRWNASSNLLPSRLRGNGVSYDDLTGQAFITAGTATTFTAASVSTFVPPESVCAEWSAQVAVSVVTPTGSYLPAAVNWSIDGGATIYAVTQFIAVDTISSNAGNYASAEQFPNTGQTIYYKRGTVSVSVSGYVKGYRVANGG